MQHDRRCVQRAGGGGDPDRRSDHRVGHSAAAGAGRAGRGVRQPGAAARESLRPDVARHAGKPLAKINAWGEAAEGIGYLAGPALAGLLLLLVGGFGTLWTSVVLFGLALVVTAVTIPAHLSPAPHPEPYLRSVKEGLLYVLRDRTLRAVTLVAAVIWVFILPFETVVLNAHLQETGQVAAFGAILAAYAGGGIAGALGTARSPTTCRPGRRWSARWPLPGARSAPSRCCRPPA